MNKKRQSVGKREGVRRAIRRLHAKGRTTAEIAHSLRRTWTATWRLQKRMGLIPNQLNTGRVVKELVAAGKTPEEVIASVPRHRKTVVNYLRRLGVVPLPRFRRNPAGTILQPQPRTPSPVNETLILEYHALKVCVTTIALWTHTRTDTVKEVLRKHGRKA